MDSNAIQILLVEDNLDDLELTMHAFRKDKLANRIQVARNGEEALDFIFARGPYAGPNDYNIPRMVLLDLKLPKVDGLEVLRQIKRNEHTRAIPVVILTSSKEQRDLIEGYKLGVNSYIQKPVDFDQFRETIKQLGLYWLVVNEPPPVEAVQAR